MWYAFSILGGGMIAVYVFALLWGPPDYSSGLSGIVRGHFSPAEAYVTGRVLSNDRETRTLLVEAADFFQPDTRKRMQFTYGENEAWIRQTFILENNVVTGRTFTEIDPSETQPGTAIVMRYAIQESDVIIPTAAIVLSIATP